MAFLTKFKNGQRKPCIRRIRQFLSISLTV